MRSFLFLLLIGLSLRAEPVRLASGGHALMPIVIGEKASAATKSTAAELARYLSRITGAEFAVEPGDGNRGIVIGTAAEFSGLPFKTKFGTGPFEREDYLLRSLPEGLYLIGAGEPGVADAAWDLLHRLGYRQFFPGETWEIVPETRELAIAVETLESPSFYARRIWYNWGLWGYNEEPYRQWCVRNRAVQGFKLNSGHSYEAIIAANRAAFENHPEYFAQVAGKREPRGDAKFCISNTDLRRLVVEWAAGQFRAAPQLDSISMDPSDGGGWCECEKCATLGSVSDRVVTLANEVAIAINALGLGPKYVGLYAYNQHCAPPHLRVDAHVIPSATTAFITGGFTFDQVLKGWQEKGAVMGVYDYLSVVDWDWNLPRGGAASRPRRVAESIARIHGQGARFYDAESGDCWGPCGLGYYIASRVLWNVKEDVDAIITDFLEKAFGSAHEPMRAFYSLINEDTQRRSPSDLVGRMYRHLDRARAATDDPKVLRRINDLILYTRHAELYYAYANGAGSVDDVARHAYRMRKTMMVHSYGLWARLLSQKAAHTPEHPLKNEAPFEAAELNGIVSSGIAKNQPVEPGFAGVEFSKDLLPAAPRLALAKTQPGHFPEAAQDRQRYYVWLPEKGGGIDLKVAVKKVWALRAPKLLLFSPQEVSLEPVAVREDYKPDGEERALSLKSPYPGLHRIESYDGGDYTRITWPAGLPVTVDSGMDTPDVTSQFRGPWTLYFYVPKKTRLIGGWASRIANWAPKISGKLLAPDGMEMLDFSKLDDGFFKVEVPPGMDGALWKLETNVGQRLLMTVPPYLARSGDELLLPREVIEADAVH
ncbi:MAG: hypothetical protein JWL90_3811 [Chthoniobacteraceae bacterium]|nr:hypothetical protein [Chthoniobacteraceae bacterium]